MSETEATNGHDDSLIPPWLPGAEAMAFLGVGSQKLSKLALAKSIVRKWENGAWLYERSSLATHLENSSENDEKLTANNTELVSLLKVSVTHAEQSFRMVHEPARQMLEFYKAELALARARIQHLEAAHDTAVQAREAAMSEQHARELETEMARRKADRWDAAFHTLKETGPALLIGAFETLADAKDPAKLAALRLIQRLTPERIASMLSAEALDAEERTFLQAVLREQAERKAAAEAEQKPAGDAADTRADTRGASSKTARPKSAKKGAVK